LTQPGRATGRYSTCWSIVVAYLPLGFLLALALRRLPGGRWTATIVALLLGSLLSLAMEFLQNWLPARVSSNLDLACNTAGAAIGAVIAFSSGRQIFRRIGEVQQTLLAPLEHLELGLVLLGTWLLTQLSPETLLFTTGDLRSVLQLTPAVPYAAHSFFVLEAGVIALNTIVIGPICAHAAGRSGSTASRAARLLRTCPGDQDTCRRGPGRSAGRVSPG
jgi:hypothetical protein